MVSQRSLLLLVLAKYITVSVFCLIPFERFSHETIQEHFFKDEHSLINHCPRSE